MGWFSCGVGGKSQNSIASWVTVVICFLAKWSGFWGDSVEGPRPDLELSVAVAAGGDDTAVGAEPHGVDRARRNGHDVAPMAHIALTGLRPAYCDDGPIGPESDAVVAARRHGDDVGPVLDSGPELRTSGRANSAVLQQANGVEIARRHCTHPMPVVHLAPVSYTHLTLPTTPYV